MKEKRALRKISVPNSAEYGAGLPFSFTRLDKQSFSSPVFKHHSALEVEGGGMIFICLVGSGQLIIEEQSYEVSRNVFCIIFPHAIVHTIGCSEDFKGILITVASDFLDNLAQLPVADYYSVIQQNPCISVSEDELSGIIEFCEFIERRMTTQGHLFRKEVLDSLLKALAFESVSLYVSYINARPGLHSRRDKLFRNFMFSLSKNVKDHRTVEFYAGEACLTTRHFSAVIKSRSGKSPLQWIHEKTILRAKSLLLSTDMSVQQISNELNFANPSFFTKYFSKHAGVTPKVFRMRNK